MRVQRACVSKDGHDRGALPLCHPSRRMCAYAHMLLRMRAVMDQMRAMRHALRSAENRASG